MEPIIQSGTDSGSETDEEVRAQRTLNRLYERKEPNLHISKTLVEHERANTENEDGKLDKEKKALCLSLAKHAWKAVDTKNNKMSCVEITSAFRQIFGNKKATKFYGYLLCDILEQLSIDRAKKINEETRDAFKFDVLTDSWTNHNLELQFLLDFFVPDSVQGVEMREKLRRSAVESYRKFILVESTLHQGISSALEGTEVTRDQKISAIKILNATDGQFFYAHLSSTLVKLTQLMEQNLADDKFSTADLIFEAGDWLEFEKKAFEIISASEKQTQLFMKNIRNHIIKNLLAGHLKDVEKFNVFVNGNNSDALHQLYRLFQEADNGINELLELVANFIKNHKTPRQGSLKTAFNGSPKSPNRVPLSVLVVNDFLAFKSLLFNSILNDCFSGDRRCRDRIELELQRLVLSHDHFSQYLAFYIDYQLKRRQNESVTKATDLLRYINDKDAFEQFYRGHLAARLINGTPSDLAAEKLLVDKLKEENGIIYTRKMEKMLNDVAISRDLIVEFAQTLTPGAVVNLADSPPPLIKGVHFTATVLTENQWPAHYRPTICHLPLHTEDLFALFEKFYLEKHSGRKLQLNVGSGSAVLSARFFGPDALQTTRTHISNNDASSIDLGQMRSTVKKSFVVTPSQMSIFDLFNTRSFVTVQELLRLNLSSKTIQRSILPAIKLHVLCRQGDTEPNFTADSTDIYYVNDEFRCKKPTINLRK